MHTHTYIYIRRAQSALRFSFLPLCYLKIWSADQISFSLCMLGRCVWMPWISWIHATHSQHYSRANPLKPSCHNTVSILNTVWFSCVLLSLWKWAKKNLRVQSSEPWAAVMLKQGVGNTGQSRTLSSDPSQRSGTKTKPLFLSPDPWRGLLGLLGLGRSKGRPLLKSTPPRRLLGGPQCGAKCVSNQRWPNSKEKSHHRKDKAEATSNAFTLSIGITNCKV